jgi:hypothetical protein
VRFEANRGQTDSKVKFVSRVGGYTLFLTETEAVWVMPGEKTTRPNSRAGKRERAAVLRMKLAGSNATPSVEGLDALPGGSNYLLGSDSSRWLSDVPAFSKVQYKSVYPGVDVVYYGGEGRLEYDFRVAAGADPRAVKLKFEGARSTRVDAKTGDLLLRVGRRELRQHAPLAYQQAGGARRVVPSRYRVARGGEVSFELGEYDARLPLVIDPAVSLAYGAFVGGGSYDSARDMHVGADGSVWIAGVTGSLDFPATAGAAQPASNDGIFGDAFVAKLNPAGDALLYATYLGGTQSDDAQALALDAAGNVYLTGYTTSPDFPTTPGAFQSAPARLQDVFVVKLNPSSGGANSLAYSTLLGGTYSDFGMDIAVDGAGRVHVVGSTNSVAFPTRNAFDPTYSSGQNNSGDDAFVLTLNPAGAGPSDLLYSTYLGGTPQDYALGVVLDQSGHTYVTGYTSSNDFPVTAGAYDTVRGDATQGVGSDSFVMKFDTAASGAASLLYSTFVGGNNSDEARDITLDSAGNVYVAGQTFSPDFPTTPGAAQTAFGGGIISGTIRADAFVTKLDINQPGASALLYSTYLGGTYAGDVAYAVAVGQTGDIYLTGRTDAADFPVTCTGVPALNQGGPFITRIDPTASGADALVYSSFFSGTSGVDTAFAVSVDSSNNVYLAGSAYSTDFPSTAGGYRNPSGSSGTEAFVAKLDQVRRFTCGATDTTPPSVSCASPDGLWHGADVGILCTVTDEGSGLANPDDASFTLYTGVAANTEDANAATGSRQVCDVAGNCVTAGPVYGNKVDKRAPAASCGSADGVWHATDVGVGCTASDGGSGLLSATDASFTLVTSVPAGTEDANASTDSRQVCDAVGNCTTAGPVYGNKVDKKGPSVTINSPAAQGYPSGSPVAADFNCSDGGSGVATCAGTVSQGSAVDTSGFGAKTFTVTSTDNVGNVTTKTVNYSVSYNVCLDYDPDKVFNNNNPGRTIPIKLHICDANGNNISSPAIVVTAVGVGLVSTAAYGDAEDSGNANPDNNFRFAGGFYIFNMSTKGLVTGSYNLYFRVGNDPALHTAPFKLR